MWNPSTNDLDILIAFLEKNLSLDEKAKHQNILVLN